MKARAAQAPSCPPMAPVAATVTASAPAQGYRLASSECDEAETIRQYVPLVKRVATHLKGRLPEPVQLDDLMQAGLIAVLRSLRRGEAALPDAPALRRTIINAMIDEVRREAWAPVRTVRLAKAAAAAIGAIKRRTGREAGDEEIAAEMGIPLAEYHRLLLDVAGMRLLSLDAFDDEGEPLLQIAGDQETSLARRRMMAALAASIAALPQRERLVVSLYYEHELNMEEVGQVLGVDKSTVCRAHGRALMMLKSALGEWKAGSLGPLSATGE